MAKTIFIIAQNNFREEELFDTKKTLEEKGHTCEIASKTKGTCTGTPNGKTIQAIKSIEELKAEDYDAIIFTGGAGAIKYQNDPAVHKIIKEANEKNKIIAAICIAPTILANTGILKGKKTTAWDAGDGKTIKQIEEKGAKYTGKDVETDGNIITANGPDASKKFGKKIAEKITEMI